ncbi:hypothetical protein ANASTE_00595 [Anaerofustis stercorihominis DSM 17244]|uniref:Uncharacterized protein n=1 Tax=Anaerofustis stercorihominis DSM 17244 TaxID=445971 RepID=B1C793_9FIRM|nr:hypothetical protein ANASTE_00595 [Anaerofustis stercorihominis DSM 17244]
MFKIHLGDKNNIMPLFKRILIKSLSIFYKNISSEHIKNH